MSTYRYYEDTRDGKIYKCVLMPDGKWWSAENLAYTGGTWQASDSQIPGAVDAYSAPFGNPANIPVLGALYWQEDTYFVPPGCHKPSGAEITGLLGACGGIGMAGLQLKSASMWDVPGDDRHGFGILPTNIGSGDFSQYTTICTNDPGPNYSHFIFLQTGGIYAEFGDYRLHPFRVIVDVFNVPSNFKLFGKSFQGFDRDATVTITRQIQVQESEGGSVTLIPTAPAEFDSWDIEAGFMVNAAQAQAIEASLPPYGTPSENALRLPPRGGGASFPGLLPLTPGETYDLYAYPMASPLDVQGRVAIGTDLFSYRMSLRFFAAHRVDSNTPTASSTTAPEWLTSKAITHSVVDPSTSIPTIQQATAGSKPLPAALDYDFHPTKQGRTRKRTITLDCLSQDRADELAGFFRGVRHNPTTITLDNGANGFEAISVYLTGLSFARGDGLYWNGSLEVVLA